MAKLVEFIPNFSEGRNQAVIDQLAAVAKSVPGITLMDVQSDESHNRCVFTLVGSPEGAEEVAFQLCKKAAELIDMRKHEGAHPRMGATDVIPFVPVKDVTVPELVELTKRLGKRIYDELGIPSFLYEDSATSPDRVNLAKVRKGQFEGMPEKLLQPEWAPDFGERKIHPTAGITAIGARMPLICFNINLDTPNVEIARRIGRRVRNKNGGFRFVKAMGVPLEERNIAQVTMNLTDYTQTSIYTVFETVRMEARRYGVRVIGSEVVGIVPTQALVDCAEYYLQIEDFSSEQLLEMHF